MKTGGDGSTCGVCHAYGCLPRTPNLSMALYWREQRRQSRGQANSCTEEQQVYRGTLDFIRPE
jgi:hypothetical protein